MGFRFRKRMQIAPGVKLNLTKKGVGLTAGGAVGRVSIHSSGRVTRSVSVPGTGLYASSSSKIGSVPHSQNGAPKAGPTPLNRSHGPRPGLLAPKWEKDLYRAVTAGFDFPKIQRITAGFPEAAGAARFLEAFYGAIPAADYEHARGLLGSMWEEGADPQRDRFLNKYVAGMPVYIMLADGVPVDMPIGRQLIGVGLAQVLEKLGDLDGAISVAQGLDLSNLAALTTLVSLLSKKRQWQDVLNLTGEIHGRGDIVAYLLFLRGEAFRETCRFDEAKKTIFDATVASGASGASPEMQAYRF